MGRIEVHWEELFVSSPSRDREVDVCFASPSSAPRASAAKAAVAATRARALGVLKVLSGDERRRGSPDGHHRRKFGTLRNDVDWCVAERRTAASVDVGARRPVTRAAAKAADGRGQDAHSASKDVYAFGLEDEQAERVSNRLYSKLPPIQKNKYFQLPLNTLKSQGRAGKRNPICMDKMYSSQLSSTSLSAKRTHAIGPEVSDHENCQNHESSLPRRFSKRRKEQPQNPSSVYSQKDNEKTMPNRGTTQLNKLIDADNTHGTTDASQEIDATKRARWTHRMKLFLIELLKEHYVSGYPTHNAWSKDAWTNIVCRLNKNFNTTFSLGQVKQQEQDLKKAYRSVKDLLVESGFGWDSARMMVYAPASAWASFAARENSKDALHWQDRSFPYFDALAPLYNEGRTCRGMDHYASKAKNTPAPSTQAAPPSPPPINTAAPGQSGVQFALDEELDETNLDFLQHSPTPVQHTPAPPSSKRVLAEFSEWRSSTPVLHTPVPPSPTRIPAEDSECRCGKKQKNRSASPDDGFHERYLKLKREEIDRFAAIEEKKLEDPYSINKCITVLEGLNGLQMGDILVAADIFKTKENREVFLSFSSDALRIAWITREIGRD